MEKGKLDDDLGEFGVSVSIIEKERNDHSLEKTKKKRKKKKMSI